MTPRTPPRRPAALAAALCALLGLGGCTIYPDWVYVSQPLAGGPAGPAPMPAPGAPPPEAAKGVPSVEPGSGALAGRVRVEPSDTLYSIARTHNVALRDLIAVNGLEPPYALMVGQLLALPVTRFHTVEKGDTVYGISRRYGVDMSALVRLNGIEPPYTITVGQRLLLPSSTRVALAPPPAAATPAGESGGAIEVTALEAPGETPTPLGENPAAAEIGEPLAGPPAAAEGPAEGALAPSTLAELGPAPSAAAGFEWPAQGPVVSSFGAKPGNLHNDGINIALAKGTPVQAAADGVVAYVGNELRGYGNLVLIRHEGGWVSAYAHNDALLVSRGQRVRRGEVIALSGDSGGVAKPQLHFELRREGVAIDPRNYLGSG